MVNNLAAAEIDGSVAHDTLIPPTASIGHDDLPLMPIGNLSRAGRRAAQDHRMVAQRTRLLALACRSLVAQAAKLERERHGTLVATPWGNRC